MEIVMLKHSFLTFVALYSLVYAVIIAGDIDHESKHADLLDFLIGVSSNGMLICGVLLIWS